MPQQSKLNNGKYNNELLLLDNETLLKKGEDHIIKIDNNDSKELIILNPYIALVNKTDILIIKTIPAYLILSHVIKFSGLDFFKAHAVVSFEISYDGFNFKPTLNEKKEVSFERIKYYDDLFLYSIESTFNQCPAGTYIRLKISNAGEEEFKILNSYKVYSDPECKGKFYIQVNLY